MTDKPRKVPPAPVGVSGRGAAVWRELHHLYDFDAHEVVLLVEVARCVSTLDSAAAQIAADGLTSTGSTGQLVAHPLLAVQTTQRAVLSRLVRQLDLPEPLPEGASNVLAQRRSVSDQARDAASARWRRDGRTS